MNAPADHTITLLSLAREALAQAEGKTEDAVAILDKRLKRNKDLRLQLLAQAVKDAAKTAVSLAHRSERATILRTIVTRHETDPQGPVKALARMWTRSLLDFPLLDGTKLREATRDDLDRAIHHYRSQADTMSKRAAWLTAIAEHVPAQGCVGDVVDDELAQRLASEAGL